VSGAERLLRWMSEEETGTWDRFKEAHNWVFDEEKQPPTPSVTAAELAALGHVEFDFHVRRWAIAPPVVNYLPPGPMLAVIAGRRTAAFEAAVRKQIRNEDHDVASFKVHQPYLPDAWFLAGRRTEIAAFAEEAGATFVDDVSLDLARCLPGLKAGLPKASRVLGAGVGGRRFDPETLQWLAATKARTPGLYRFDAFGVPRFEFVDDAGGHITVDRNVGIYLELDRVGKRVITVGSDYLAAPAAAPLPSLQARTASLCSGFAPSFAYGRLTYDRVPGHVGHAIAKSLAQVRY
jgi:hypothetical protein